MTRRPTRSCPAYGVPCELAVMADVSVAQAAEIERLRAALQDPATVHINMLRGTIAKPTLAQIIHLYGDESIRAALTAQPAAPGGDA